jgi:hypothetical protein
LGSAFHLRRTTNVSVPRKNRRKGEKIMKKKSTIENENEKLTIEEQQESTEQVKTGSVEPTEEQIVSNSEPTADNGQEVTLIDEGVANMRDLWPSLGADSTAVIDVVIMNPDDIPAVQDSEIGDWLKKSKEETGDLDEKIRSGVELARTEAANFNKVVHVAGKNLAERAFLMGAILLRLKGLSRGSGLLWGLWAEKNLTFINKRNREKFMLLAKRKDCHRYAFLGVDRLEHLCSVTKEVKGNDAIGQFLAKYQISLDEDSEVSLTEFKLSIDSALNAEKLLQNGITADLDLVKNLTRGGTEFDKSFLMKLKDIHESGGSPQTYLGKLSMNRGKESLESKDEKRLQDFNTLSNRLIKTIDFLIEDEDNMVMVDKATLEILLEKLQKLQGAASMTAIQQAA